MTGKSVISSSLALALLAGFTVSSVLAQGEAHEKKGGDKHHEGVLRLGKASKIALKSFRIKAAELEREHGRLIWSFDIAMKKSKKIVEVNVDARTGEVVATEFESAKEEAKEAKGDEGREHVTAREGHERGEKDQRAEKRESNEHREKGEKAEQEAGEHEGNHHPDKGEKQDQD
jgi:Peptidase propeptide and YPEB domain